MIHNLHICWSREQIDAHLLGALCRQLVIYAQKGVVKW